jgi:putative intracellular protease/amidase
MIIVIPLVDGFTALDAVGPYEVLSRLPEARVVFASVSAGPVQAETKMLSIVAEAALSEIPEPDIICVPGGLGTRRHIDDPELMRWLTKAHASSTWTTSVCTGALLLGATGALEGKKATTHWLELPRLGEFGAEPVDQRVVFDGKLVTAAGVSAGLDMALELGAKIAGDDWAKTVQLMIEYDPQPPFDSGSWQKANPQTVKDLRAFADAGLLDGDHP